MKYFVSIENRIYHHWQIELLIESMKMLGIDDQLVIGVAQTEHDQTIADFSKNFVAHENKFVHENVGVKYGYKPLNKIYSIIMALENKTLDFPFVLLEPNMILRKPVVVGEDVDESVNIVMTIDPDQQELHAALEDDILAIKKIRDIPEDEMDWIPMGDSLIFRHDVPIGYFHEIGLQMEHLLEEHGPQPWVDRAAWILGTYAFIGRINVLGQFNEATLLHGEEVDAPIINYQHGLPPYFNKKYFYFNEGSEQRSSLFRFGGENPYDVLMQHNPTEHTNHMQKVIRSYRKSDQ